MFVGDCRFAFDPVDWEDCGIADCGTSRRSNGFEEIGGEGFFSIRPRGLFGNAGVTGVRDPRDEPALLPFPSPSRTSVSIVFSRFPPRPFSTAKFLFGSANPISFSLFIFPARSIGPVSIFFDLEPGAKSGEGDLLRVGTMSTGGGRSRRVFEDDSGNIDEADLRPNLLPVLGGGKGGWSSEFVLPVSCLFAARSAYFPRMKRSIAESASSASIGIGGFALLGLYIRFEMVLPTRFIFCDHVRKVNHLPPYNVYLYLIIRPRIHTQRLDFCNMCAQFPVYSCTAHA